jgi:hypothetical protein
MGGVEVLVSALVGGGASVVVSSWIAVRTERGRTREVASREALGVLAELGDVLKETRLEPVDGVSRLDRDDAVDFARRLLEQTDVLGFVRRRRIRQHLGRLVGFHTVRWIDESPTPRERATAPRSTWRETVWLLEQVNDRGVPEGDVLSPGLLGEVRDALKTGGGMMLRPAWARVVNEMKAVGFWLGEWSQWRHALRRRRRRDADP